MKNYTILLLVALLQTFVANSAERKDSAQCSSSCCRPDAFAPAGIMTDHVHNKGSFSIAYSYMDMAMQGNRIGTKTVSDATIFNSYMMATNRMNMQMHMLMPMYGITNRFTLMAMLSYNANTMSMHMMPMQNMMNMPGMTMADYSKMPTSMKSSGLGDTKIYALYNVLPSCNHRLVTGLGLSLPTGSIHAKGATMQSTTDILPYNIQLGTGTYNLLPSLVYVGQGTHLSWGADFNANIKLGTNTNNYCFGNEYSVSPWLAYQFVKYVSVSARAEYYTVGKLYGYDAAINLSSLNDATANTANYGGQKANGYIGVNLYSPANILKGSKLLLEYGVPFYQNTVGLQSTVKSTITARLQFNF
ncbi:MAG TPA: hypothetical protein VK835_14355 [Bacteroidia bacterium]|jgi:hypothetical protein|nr:hypothetical protein [Bacteroidia bacterium]